MMDWLYAYLQKRLNRKKQEVIRLRWQQAQLQQLLEQEKENRR